MEFGLVHACPIYETPGPGFDLLVIVTFLICLIRSAREEPLITFGTIVSGFHQTRPRVQQPAIRRIRNLFSPVHLHALRSQIRCAYCHDLIIENESQRCPECRTLHHSECFIDGGCAIFGCTFARTLR
ncbi:hypothetical protein L0222_13770 [bacterium]|nr:hypothetical protein [bacterium]